MSTEAPTVQFQSSNDNDVRSPSWRWDRVRVLTSRLPTPGRCSRHDDEFVRQARAFAFRIDRTKDDQAARANLWFKTPDLYYAYEFYERLPDEPEASMYIQARLLAGQSFETIADIMGITTGTVKWYEALFFSVADRLHLRDWITNQVLIPALQRSSPGATKLPPYDNEIVKPFLDGSLKLFAYFGGPSIVDSLLSGFKPGAPAAADDIGGWFDRQWSFTICRRSAQAAVRFDINQSNFGELFAAQTKIVELGRVKDTSETAQATREKALKSLLDQIPLAASDERGRPHLESVLPSFNAEEAEFRDDELVRIGAGRPALTLAH